MGAAALAAAAFVTSPAAIAQSIQGDIPALIATGNPVVVIVRVPKPWYAPRAVVASKMRDTLPQYAHLRGLAFKAFSFEQNSGDYGGVYFWRDAASAQAWFSPAWFARVKSERGADAWVRMLEAPVSIDNSPGGTPASSDSTAVATLVDIPLPTGLGRERLLAGFQAAVPQYQHIPGLLRKHFTIRHEVGANTQFGGVYIWKDAASAKAWFTGSWHQRVQDTYGHSATIEWFDLPILLPTQDVGNNPIGPALITAAP
jgi:heme-degrading monooxygenase HmoA